MAKKLTVGELAKRAEAGIVNRRDTDLLKPLLAAGIGLSLAFTVLCAWQTIAAFNASLSVAGAERLAQSLSVELTEEVKASKAKLEQATQSAEIAQHLMMAENFSAAGARERVMKLIPDSVDADVIRGEDVALALGGRFAEFGFAKTDVLLEAQEQGKNVPAQLHVEKDKSYNLVIATPVVRGDSRLGYVLAKFPAKKILDKLVAFDGAGSISLQQEGIRQPVTMLVAGSGKVDAGSIKVAGSRLILSWGVTDPFALLPFSGWLTPLLLTILGLASASALSYLRSRPSLFSDMAERVRAVGARDKHVTAAKARPTSERADNELAQKMAAKIATVKAAEAPQSSAPPAPSESIGSVLPNVAVDRSIFRAYDIRGVVGSTLNEGVAELIGRALGSEIVERGQNELVVARDGRLSGPALSGALIRGALAAGCNVIDLGAVPTPVLYFATIQLNTGSGVMITGSHNPPDYNGFKMVLGGVTLAEQAIQALYSRINARRFTVGSGLLQSMDVTEDYVDRISSDIQLENPLRVVVDAGNGIAGGIAPTLLQAIGCEVEQLHCEVDGKFPNHHPDPSDPANLSDLKIAVKQMNADIGVAFDGDGDRLGVVTRSGKIIYPDRLLILFAQDVLMRQPGASIIYDVKCTGALAPAIRSAGGVPIMYKTGHSLIKGKMKETNAALAGEMSGHFFFKERWFGFDDGMYAACRLLEILASSGLDADDLFDDIPDAISTPELKIEMKEGEHYRFMERFAKQAKFADARITTIDGIRADFDQGWGLVRCSNTTPCLVLRFEANSTENLQKIINRFKEQLLIIDKSLNISF